MRSTKLPSWIDRLLGLEPVPAPPHVFALGPASLRYGSFHRDPASGKGFDYAAGQERGLAPDTFASGLLGGPVRDFPAFREEVRAFVASLAGPIEEASLVLPDSWLRLTFVEITEVPRRARDRQEVLRFKLKRQVPFRVEELRISATEVTPFPNQEEPRRLLLGFAIEALLAQLEQAFSDAGVALGAITNDSLAVLRSLEHAVDPADLAVLVMVQEDAYTVSYFRGGEPLLYRYKAIGEMAEEARVAAVHRDLRLTTSFMAQHFPETPLRRAFLAAAPGEEERWLGWLYEELETPAEPLAFEHFHLARTQVGPSWLQTAPLLGAASLEVE